MCLCALLLVPPACTRVWVFMTFVFCLLLVFLFGVFFSCVVCFVFVGFCVIWPTIQLFPNWVSSKCVTRAIDSLQRSKSFMHHPVFSGVCHCSFSFPPPLHRLHPWRSRARPSACLSLSLSLSRCAFALQLAAPPPPPLSLSVSLSFSLSFSPSFSLSFSPSLSLSLSRYSSLCRLSVFLFLSLSLSLSLSFFLPVFLSLSSDQSLSLSLFLSARLKLGSQDRLGCVKQSALAAPAGPHKSSHRPLFREMLRRQWIEFKARLAVNW